VNMGIRSPELQGMTLIDRFAEADEILNSPDFAPVMHMTVGAPELFYNTVLSLHGERHFERRRLEAPLFRRALLEHAERQLFEPLLESRLQILRSEANVSGDSNVDLLSALGGSLIAVTGVIVGLDDLTSTDNANRLRNWAIAFGKGASKDWSEDPTKLLAAAVEARDEFVRELLLPSWRRRMGLVKQYRESGLDRTELPFDLVTLLLLHDWPFDEIAREATLFVHASVNTNTNASCLTIVELMSWLALHPDDWSRVGEPSFMQSVANETLRLHPLVPGLLRRATTSGRLRSSQRRYRVDEKFYIELEKVNRDPEVFGPDASSFSLGDKASKSSRPFGMTFGSGPHMCIGRPLALRPSTGSTSGEDSQAIGLVARAVITIVKFGVTIDVSNPPRRVTTSMQSSFDEFRVQMGH
jgi:cytochrome P450